MADNTVNVSNNNYDGDDSGVVIIDDNDEVVHINININNDDVKNKIDIIMGQTDYGAEEARKLLAETNGDEIAVIRMYLGLPPPSDTTNNNNRSSSNNVAAPKSKNQLIYQEIRKFMDGCKEDINKQ